MGKRGGAKGGAAANNETILNSSKGTFKFTKLKDGLYVQHMFGANSGQIGIPTDALLKFAGIVSEAALPAGKAVAMPAAAKSKGITKKEQPKKEKKAPEPKPTLEDLDADLTSYLSARNGGEAGGAEAEA